MTRLKINEQNGSEKRATSFSQRAAKGKLTVEKEDCPFCHHHKVLENTTMKKCARCKQEIKYRGK